MILELTWNELIKFVEFHSFGNFSVISTNDHNPILSLYFEEKELWRDEQQEHYTLSMSFAVTNADGKIEAKPPEKWSRFCVEYMRKYIQQKPHNQSFSQTYWPSVKYAEMLKEVENSAEEEMLTDIITPELLANKWFQLALKRG